VSVTDNIPAQFTSWTWTCLSSSGGASGCDGYGPGNANFTDSIDLAGPFPSSITYQVVAQVASSATGDLTNTVTISHPADSTPDDNTASDTDTQHSQADLYVTKTDGQPTYTPGVGLTYTVVVGNNGPSDVSGAVVSDTRPAQVTSWTWTCAGTSGGASGCDGDNTNPATFTDTVDLPAGSSITYSVTVTIPFSATGNLVNTVTVAAPSGVTDPKSGNNTASDTDTPNPQADLSVTKDDSVTQYIPGGTLTYTITVTNAGPSDALGVSVTDNIPAQFTSWTWTCFSSSGGASGCTPYSGSGNFTDSIDLAGPFPSSITYQVVAQVASSATGDLTNTVTISHPADSTPDDNTASDTDTQHSQADLYVTKTDGQPTYTPGVGLTYTVVVGNNGPSDVSGAVVSDTRPAQVTSWTWTCAGTSGGASGCDGDNTNPATFTDTVDLPAGSSITYSVTVTIPFSATGNLVNTVTVAAPSGVTDPKSGNNTASDTDTPNPQADLSVTKDDSVTQYIPGGTLTYTITVTNAGPSDALGVSVTDNIPAQFTSWTWTCFSSSGGASGCTPYSGSGNFTDSIDLAGPFPSSITYQVVAQVASSATGNLTNTVTISHPADSTPDDNTASDTDTPNPQADLTVTKDDGVTVIAPDSTITYTIIVTNTGPSDANGATVSDPKPSQIDTWTWVCTASSGGATGCDGYGPGNADFSDTVNLPAGSSIKYTVTAHIDASATSGTLTNTVTVTPPGGVTDPTPGNNSDDDVDQIVAQPTGDLTKSLIATNQSFTSNPSVAIGEMLTYEVTFTVPAGGTMTNLTLTDTLDRGLAFVDCLSVTASDPITTTLPGGFGDACNDPTNPTVATEPPGSPNPADAGRKITFDLGDVSNSSASNGTVSVRYTVVVLDSIENQDGVRLNNSATLTWDSGSLSTAAPEVTIVEPDFELTKEADRTVATPGSVITFTLTLRHTNASNVDAFDVVLTDVLPPGLTYVPGSLTIVSGPPGGVPDDTGAPTLRVTWANFPLLTGSNRTQAVVRFQAVLGNLAPGQRVRNTALLEWTSLPGDVSSTQSQYNDLSSTQSQYNDLSTERYYDPLSDVNVYGVSASLDITVPRLPSTGFAPGVVTPLPAQPAEKAYQALGDLWLEIPKLGLKMPIVGIPARGEEWDLTWLWDQAGWLEGTAYPTHAGNSAITAHVYLPNGQPGPFYKLDALRFGDAVIVHLGGQRYVFEVRQVQRVSPNTLSALRHEELPWLTLITCREYDPKTNSYRSRLIVRAVLVKILE
jgi:LPXTG-site transpeptidase (sortase) family protein